MKKLFCILLVYLLISCDNSLDINDEWRDIPVIYGILDPGTNEPNLELVSMKIIMFVQKAL